MRILPSLLASLVLISCHPKEKTAQASARVEHHGALREIMHQGDLSSRIELNTLSNRKHLYALGAVDGLKGEIVIWDSSPYIAHVRDSNLTVRNDWNTGAALLVHAEVPKWKEVELNAPIADLSSLERIIARKAVAAGIDTNHAFPFLLKGQMSSVDWHVINWPEGDTVHSHAKHIASGLHGTATDLPAAILGFFSHHHKAVFTHHSRLVHLHLLSDNRALAGHVDGLKARSGLRLYIPRNE